MVDNSTMFPRLGWLQGSVELARCCRHPRLWGQWMKMHRRWLSAFCPPVRPVRPNGSLLFIGGPRRRGDDCSKPNLGVPARLVSGTPNPRPPSMETPTQSGDEKLLSHHPRWRSHRGVTWWLAYVHSLGVQRDLRWRSERGYLNWLRPWLRGLVWLRALPCVLEEMCGDGKRVIDPCPTLIRRERWRSPSNTSAVAILRNCVTTVCSSAKSL